MCGITAEAAASGWAEKLTPEETKNAVIYATIELNGFPPWFLDLVNVHPKVVDTVLGTELATQLKMHIGHQHLPLLQDLTYADSKVKQIFAPRLLTALLSWDRLTVGEDAVRHSEYHLEQVIRILHETNNDEDRVTIASECESRFTADPGGPHSLTWLKGLFRFDPDRGTRSFENGLSVIDVSERAEYAIKTFALLFGDRDRTIIDIESPYDRAIILGRLVWCAYNYVRREEDITHDDVYSPNTRDNAESARSFLLSTLLDTPGPEARSVILKLATDPHFAHFPDRLRLLARNRAASDAEFEPLSPKDLTALEERLEAAPPHDRDGLFNVMVDRLDDIAHNIAHDDFTDRRTLRTITEEIEMQRTIARRLKETAKGAYIVIREDEVADQKKTDIRLAAVNSGQKAVIEIKIADKRWSLTQLEQALRDQLVGQYLRHESSKSGCLLLTYDGSKNYWVHSATGDQFKFVEAVDYLKKVAKEIEREKAYEIRLTVYGLDLTDPILAAVHR